MKIIADYGKFGTFRSLLQVTVVTWRPPPSSGHRVLTYVSL